MMVLVAIVLTAIGWLFGFAFVVGVIDSQPALTTSTESVAIDLSEAHLTGCDIIQHGGADSGTTGLLGIGSLGNDPYGLYPCVITIREGDAIIFTPTTVQQYTDRTLAIFPTSTDAESGQVNP